MELYDNDFCCMELYDKHFRSMEVNPGRFLENSSVVFKQTIKLLVFSTPSSVVYLVGAQIVINL